MTGRAVAVVGAGIAGCLIARELAARDPQAVITVLDRDLVGSGVTRRSAGLSLVKGSTPRTMAMSAFSHDYYAALAAGNPCLPFHPVSARLILTDDRDPAGLGYLPDHTSTDHTGPDHTSPDHTSTAPALTGRLGAEVCLPAGARVWRIGGCHYADVYGLTQAIAACLRPRVSFAEAVRVTGLAVSNSGVTLSCGSGERLTADQVVLAPGPWFADPAWADLLSPLGLRVKKIVAMHLEGAPKPDDELIMLDAEDAFLLPVAHRGHWLFSYTSIEWDVDPDALTGGLTAADVEAARACLRPYSGALADACVSGRVCCDAYSPDHQPVVRVVDGTQGRVVFAGGGNGSGYRLGPAIAAEAVNLLYETASKEQPDDHQHL